MKFDFFDFIFICSLSWFCFSFSIALITGDFSSMVFPVCWILFNFCFFTIIHICLFFLRGEKK